jgi:hypothetical protein
MGDERGCAIAASVVNSFDVSLMSSLKTKTPDSPTRLSVVSFVFDASASKLVTPSRSPCCTKSDSRLRPRCRRHDSGGAHSRLRTTASFVRTMFAMSASSFVGARPALARYARAVARNRRGTARLSPARRVARVARYPIAKPPIGTRSHRSLACA